MLAAGVVLLGAALLPAAAVEAPRLIVAIVVDQLRTDQLERWHDQFSRGGLKLLMDRGTFMTSARYDYAPTVTAPGHATYLSGTPPSVHGIIGNEWFDRQRRKVVVAVDDTGFDGVGTTSTNVHVSPRNFIGDNFADQMRLRFGSKVVGVSMKARSAVLPAGKKPAGAYWFEHETGNFITSTYYRSELPDWARAFNEARRVECYRDTNWTRLLPANAYEFPDDRHGEGHLIGETNRVFPHRVRFTDKERYEAVLATPFSNELLAEFALAALDGEALGGGPQPDLLCVSFSALDSCGHKFGPYGQETQDVLLRLDRTLEQFFRQLDRRVGQERVLIVLTSDHGVAPLPEFARTQGLDGRRIDEGRLFNSLTNHLTGRFGSADFFLSRKFHYGSLYYDFAALQRAGVTGSELSGSIADWAYGTGKIQAVFTRDQLLHGRFEGELGRRIANGYHAERGGDIVIVLKPYSIPTSDRTGTTHGSPFHYDTHVPVLFRGPSFRPGRYAAEFNITDIVPTLCSALRLEQPAGSTGRIHPAIIRGN